MHWRAPPIWSLSQGGSHSHVTFLRYVVCLEPAQVYSLLVVPSEPDAEMLVQRVVDRLSLSHPIRLTSPLSIPSEIAP